ncbi:kappaPI-actitoxin-Ael3a-like isoform X1 [Notamacropus eugenii]|uniref:kappaPI-actitoxin-Ael3a-like isoform X1 n=1 Tax=Notamacropus eugenii TaxID=9315 RepID=UPI003B67D1E9
MSQYPTPCLRSSKILPSSQPYLHGPQEKVMEQTRQPHPKRLDLKTFAWRKQSICKAEEDQGFCRGYFLRWFFNTTSRNCETFIYGGCGGNSNNFHSKLQCIGKCILWG